MKISEYVTFCQKEISSEKIFLSFSGRTGKNIQLSANVYHQLREKQWDKISPEILLKLQEIKILVPDDEIELTEIIKENKESDESDTEDYMYYNIQTSAYCQLDCDYCGQIHERRNISEDIIDKVVDRIKSRYTKEKKRIEIGWFGGEPLLALKEMRIINRKVKQFAEEKGIKYFSRLTTNGIALNLDVYKEMITDFNANRIEITIDGTAEYHDRRRYTKGKKSSFDIIFKNMVEAVNHKIENQDKCMISIRCNVDQRNFDGVKPLLNKLAQLKLQDHVFFYVAQIRSWAQNKANRDLSMEEFGDRMIDYYLEMRKLGFKVSGVLPGRRKMQSCVATSKYCEMYDAYGNIFDCTETSYTPIYENTELVLGNINKVHNKEVKRSSLLDFNSKMNNGAYKMCMECKFFPLCAGGCPKSWYDKDPVCPYFTYNLEDLMLLDFLFRKTTFKALENEYTANVL